MTAFTQMQGKGLFLTPGVLLAVCTGSHELLFSNPQCIEVMGDGCLNNEHFEELGVILKAKLEEHFKNQMLPC